MGFSGDQKSKLIHTRNLCDLFQALGACGATDPWEDVIAGNHIPAHLAGQGVASFDELAEFVGVAGKAIDEVLSDGAGDGVLDLIALGLTDTPADLAAAGEALAKFPEVAYAAATTGAANLAACVICRDETEFYEFLTANGQVLYGPLAAYALLFSLPVLVLYWILSRHITGAFTFGGGVKG